MNSCRLLLERRRLEPLHLGAHLLVLLLELHHLEDLLLELHHLEDQLLELDRLVGLLLELHRLEDRLPEDRHLEGRLPEDHLPEDRHWGVHHWGGRYLEVLLLELEQVPLQLEELLLASQHSEGLHHLQLRLQFQTLLLVCAGNLIVPCQSHQMLRQAT